MGLPPHTPALGLQCAPPSILRIQIQVLTFAQWARCPLSHLPSPGTHSSGPQVQDFGLQDHLSGTLEYQVHRGAAVVWACEHWGMLSPLSPCTEQCLAGSCGSFLLPQIQSFQNPLSPS